VRRNCGGLPSFWASFSKTRVFWSKDFQRNLWRFCAISIGYKGSKPKELTSKSFRRAGLLLDALSAPPGRFLQVAPRGVERVRPRTESVFVASGGGQVHHAASVRVESKHHSMDFGFPKEKTAVRQKPTPQGPLAGPLALTLGPSCWASRR
jgi:hypothetical protein